MLSGLPSRIGTRLWFIAGIATCSSLLLGCNVLLGLDEAVLDDSTGTGGQASTASTGTLATGQGAAGGGEPCSAATVTDDFLDRVIDQTKWAVGSNGGTAQES
jgi:hypothetical protein